MLGGVTSLPSILAVWPRLGCRRPRFFSFAHHHCLPISSFRFVDTFTGSPGELMPPSFTHSIRGRGQPCLSFVVLLSAMLRQYGGLMVEFSTRLSGLLCQRCSTRLPSYTLPFPYLPFLFFLVRGCSAVAG